MNAFLLALVVCFLSEMGDRGQRLTALLGQRFRRPMLVLAGVAAALFLTAGLTAWASELLVSMLRGAARSLFMGMALLSSGVLLLLPARRVDPLDGWRLGAFGTAFAGLSILFFGEGAQFLIAGIAAGRGQPWLAAAGGALGMLAACALGLIREVGDAHATLRAMRRLSGAAFTLWGATLILSAL